MEDRLRYGLIIGVIGLCVICSKSDNSEIKNCLPPNIKKQATSGISYFIADTKVEIPCIARGDGKLTYTWLKDGVVLDLNGLGIKDRAAMSTGVGTLSLHALEEDEGLYQCSVVNECGTSLSQKVMLKLARMVPFPLLNKPTEYKRHQGSSLILTCNPPESVPKAKITWILTDPQASRISSISDNKPAFSNVPLDKRVTSDYNGNLYITSVRKEDEQGGKIYVCQAENTFTRSTNKGEDKRISVPDGPISDMGVDLMWHSDTQTLVLEGQVAKFKCIFSGQPEPAITWTKEIGSNDKNRVKILNHEMIINDVRYEDAGEYKCSARKLMSEEFRSHTFTLTVEAAPMWKTKPREVTVGVEENAMFVCEAEGRPTPTVSWFINGRPYQELPPNARRELKGSTLSFTNLEKDDSQVIQCNATNVHGSIWSDVYLYVQAIAPVIELKPLDELVVAEDQIVRVLCQVSGKPKPRVVWYKNNQQLILGKFEVEEDGNLLIKKTEKKDTGSYRCSATNKFGTAEATGKVTVRERTRIETKPISTDVDYTNTVTFTCGATTDPNESSNLKIRWLKDGVELKPNDRVIIERGVITITETNSKDTGTYTCLAENGLDNDTAIATLKVKAVPDPPYNVVIKECIAKKATLEWNFDEKMSNFDTMTKYIIEYTLETNSEVWKEIGTTSFPQAKISVDLSPYAKYWFRVRAVNLMGISEPSEITSASCVTPMSLPQKNPSNVHTDESSTGFLVVKWDRVERIDQNGPGFQYVVHVQKKVSDVVQVFKVDDYRITEKRIATQDIYSPYLIKVRSENQVGLASDPESVDGHSGEAPPLVVPENFEIDPDVNLTATMAGFMWDPVDENIELIRGKFSGYKIRFWKSGEMDTTLHEHIVQVDSSVGSRTRRQNENKKIRGTVANLPSYADIEADVVVINKNFESNGSNVVNFSTPEGVPGRVAFLEAPYRGSNHFLLTWDRPNEPNGAITGYQLSYRKTYPVKRLDVGKEIIVSSDLGPDAKSAKLEDLEQDSQYRIFIRAQTKVGLGEEFFIDVQTTSNLSSIALPEIQNVFPGENDANVTWNTFGEKGIRHGQLYYIEFLKRNTDTWIRSKNPAEGQNWGMLKHLEPGTQYDVRVVAISHTKDRNDHVQFGKPVTFVTAGIGWFLEELRNTPEETIETFYEELNMAMEQCKSKEITLMMGDFNAKVEKVTTDNVTGEFGLGERNEICERLIKMGTC